VTPGDCIVKTAVLAGAGRSVCPRAAQDISSPLTNSISHPKLIPAIAAIILAVLVTWLCSALYGWRRIMWRDHMDTPIDLIPKQVRGNGSWAAWKILAHDEEVVEPSLVLLRVRNSGLTTISKAAVRRAITFTFPGREVKEFTVTDCRGVVREHIQPPGESTAAITGNRITLPRFSMKRRSSFKLLVLLSGPGRGVLGRGRIRRGKVVHESFTRSPLARNVAFGTVLALLIGIQAGITASQGPIIPSSCRTGQLILEGSTAFAPTAKQIGEAYTGVCHSAAISVAAIATFNGLNAVNSLGSAKEKPLTPQIAMSDGPAPSGYPALAGHPIAVIIFAVVLNRDTGVFNLTIPEIRGIFRGRITNWRQVGGANLPIRIVARTTGSGTRATFDSKVLGLAEPSFSSYNCLTKDAVPDSPVTRCEVTDTKTLLERVNSTSGAIGYAQTSGAAAYSNVETIKLNGWDPVVGAVQRGDYPFWTVEYLYTYGTPAPGSLSASFLGYLNTGTAKDILRSQGYTPCVDRGDSLVGTLCPS
jgi:ABC-type phosphate transport system substrate-binding protein